MTELAREIAYLTEDGQVHFERGATWVNERFKQHERSIPGQPAIALVPMDALESARLEGEQAGLKRAAEVARGFTRLAHAPDHADTPKLIATAIESLKPGVELGQTSREEESS